MGKPGKVAGGITEQEWENKKAKSRGKIVHLIPGHEKAPAGHKKPLRKTMNPEQKKKRTKRESSVRGSEPKGENIMDECERSVGKLTRFLDQIAGIAIITAMLLVVINIALRIIPGANPILGTYEYVGFLAAIIAGLAIAHCAFQNCHIAVGFIMDKVSPGIRAAADIFIHLISVIFLAFTSYEIAVYGRTVVQTGMVSPTTKTPVYPFIYLLALGVAILGVVLLTRTVKAAALLFSRPAAISFRDKTKLLELNRIAQRVKAND